MIQELNEFKQMKLEDRRKKDILYKNVSEIMQEKPKEDLDDSIVEQKAVSRKKQIEEMYIQAFVRTIADCEPLFPP